MSRFVRQESRLKSSQESHVPGTLEDFYANSGQVPVSLGSDHCWCCINDSGSHFILEPAEDDARNPARHVGDLDDGIEDEEGPVDDLRRLKNKEMKKKVKKNCQG